MASRRGRSGKFAVGALAGIAALAVLAGAGESRAAGAADAAIKARVKALVARMTQDEKISLVHGAVEPADDQGQAGYWPGLPRLGIPPLRLTDGPPGVLTRRPASALPATMALAATFSRTDAELDGAVIGHSAKALGQQIVLEPYINIHRDQTFNRAYNTYGEDPLLSGEIAAGVVKGVQAQGVMAQAKHFIAYDGGNDVTVGGQALHEIYLAPFKATVDAGVSSLMCSYNHINGPYACGSTAMLEDVLRRELGFKGFVTSDWGAVHDADFVAKGLDLEMPGAGARPTFMTPVPVRLPPNPAAAFTPTGALPEEPAPAGRGGGGGGAGGETPTGLLAALSAGAVKTPDLDRAVSDILYEVAKFGWLDRPPSLAQSPDPAEAAAPALRKVAADAAVLLKNEGGALPLKRADLASLALIGPGAGQLIAVGQAGEKALGHVERQVSPLAALRGGAGANITFAVDNDMDGTAIPAAALSHDGGPGFIRADGGVDSVLDHTAKAGAALPAGTKAVWTGTLTVPAAGRYRLHLQVIGASAGLSIDGQPAVGTARLALHGAVLQPGQDNILPTTDGLDNVRIERELTAGPHPLRIEVQGDDSGAPVQVRLAWVTPEQRAANRAAAVAAAKAAKTAVVFAWSRDRPSFGLPGDQDALIEAVAAANPNTVVVLNVSEPVAMPWLDKVKAVLLAWFPGDEGGWATADLLTGKADPGGRLPFTWSARLQDNVANDPAHPERSSAGVGGKTSYSEGVLVGYRWFDSQNIGPLFPFGHGLSYTRFAYSNLKVARGAGGSARASVTVKNIGPVAGDEVVQLYLGAPAKPPADGQFAPQSLAGFERVSLEPGQSKTLTIDLPARRFEYWSEQRRRWVRAGGRRLSAGASSRDLKLSVAAP